MSDSYYPVHATRLVDDLKVIPDGLGVFMRDGRLSPTGEFGQNVKANLNKARELRASSGH